MGGDICSRDNLWKCGNSLGERGGEKIGRGSEGSREACTGSCANELEGEVGWQSFREREVAAKLKYWQRMKSLEEGRWVGQLQRAKQEKG